MVPPSRNRTWSDLEPVQEGLQIIQPEGAPNCDCLSSVSGPEEAIGITTQ